MDKPTVGFIGIGVMGTPMAGHLAAAGYKLRLNDIDRHNADRLADRYPNVVVVETPKAVADLADFVITMLPSGEFVRDVALGQGGLIHGLKPGAILLDTSSSEPWLTVETARELAANQIAMVDAPVSGARIGADAAELVFMVGGDPAAVSRVSPLLDVLGKQAFHLGPVGAGHAMKCINNLITAVTFMATAEGLTLGKRLGLDPSAMNKVLNVSTGMSWITQNHIEQRILNRKFDDPFKLELLIKDIGIAMRTAEQHGHPLPLAKFAQDLWQQAEGYAGPGSSVSSMVRWVEEKTGIELTAD
jgi:3-hydroxyisobutyrate dehydrogenase